jgi:hypothetical protein
MSETRRSLEESWASFKGERGHWAPPYDAQGRPYVPDHHAGIEREIERGENYVCDIMFFRSGREESDLSNLTLPRRYINRSDFQRVSFRNTDLSQSFMCWNDFIQCDFTDADLTCCDMRASVFQGCTFVRCKLIGADLRRSSFQDCDFTEADLTGARSDGDQDLDISDEQRDQIDWEEDEGPQPKGG